MTDLSVNGGMPVAGQMPNTNTRLGKAASAEQWRKALGQPTQANAQPNQLAPSDDCSAMVEAAATALLLGQLPVPNGANGAAMQSLKDTEQWRANPRNHHGVIPTVLSPAATPAIEGSPENHRAAAGTPSSKGLRQMPQEAAWATTNTWSKHAYASQPVSPRKPEGSQSQHIAQQLLYPEGAYAQGYISHLSACKHELTHSSGPSITGLEQVRPPWSEHFERQFITGENSLTEGESGSSALEHAHLPPPSMTTEGGADDGELAHLPGTSPGAAQEYEWQRRRMTIVAQDGELHIWLRDYRLNDEEQGGLVQEVLNRFRQAQGPVHQISINGRLAWHAAAESGIRS